MDGDPIFSVGAFGAGAFESVDLRALAQAFAMQHIDDGLHFAIGDILFG